MIGTDFFIFEVENQSSIWNNLLYYKFIIVGTHIFKVFKHSRAQIKIYCLIVHIKYHLNKLKWSSVDNNRFNIILLCYISGRIEKGYRGYHPSLTFY